MHVEPGADDVGDAPSHGVRPEADQWVTFQAHSFAEEPVRGAAGHYRPAQRGYTWLPEPPSTERATPLMYDAAFEARNTTAAATSSGVP